MNSLLLKIALLLCVASLPFGHSDLVVNDSRHVESYRQYRNESRLVCVTRSKSRCVRWLFHEECRDIYYCEHQRRYDVQYSTIFRCQSGWKTYPDCDIPICSNCTAGTRCTAPNICTELSREHPSRRLVPVISVTDAELSYITEKIWISDGNRVKDSDVPYNTKGPKLFGKVNSEAFVKKPTFATMIALFGNYNEDLTGSSVSRKQEDAFLDAILYTRPIEKAYNWLYGRGLTSSPTLKVFKDELRQYWFARNTRQQGGSNGFTHVFLGEFDNGRVKGLHNWVRMYLAERDGIFAYRGHKKGCEPAIEEVEFDWKLTYHKTSSSLFIRTSPEVEIALYTVCLLARPNGCCHIQLKSNDKWLTPAITASDKKDPKYTFKTISTAFPQCNC